MSDIFRYECLRLNFETYSLLYYQKENMLILEFFDEIDQDEVEVCIWDETGFHLEESPIKDIDFLNTQLLYMRDFNDCLEHNTNRS